MGKFLTANFARRASLLATSAQRSLTILAIVVWIPVAQAAQVITVGPNVNVSKLAGNQSETSIAINRLNTDLITIGANDIASPNLFLRYSNNGGTTWNTSSFNPNACCDTWMGADNFGNMYLSYLTGAITTNIARSTDGGFSYTNIATIAGSSDHPELGVGPGLVAGTSSIFVRDSTSSGNRIISGTSTGLGVTSAFTTQAAGLGSGNFGSTAVGPGGRTAFTSMNPAGGVGPASMTIRYDADGTGPGAYVTQSTITTNVGGFRPIPAQPSRTIDAQVDLEYDSSGGVNNGNLYMLYTQAANTTTNDTNIVFRRSTDNGLTFSNELKINDDVSTMSQFFGRLAVDQKTGWLASVWYDARNSASNNTVELWGSMSFDGGLSWASNFKISDGITSCVAATIGNDGNECGDYIALDFFDGKLVTSWADSSNSTGDNPNGRSRLDVYFSKVTVTNVVGQVPEPSTWLSMIVGFGVVGAGLRRVRKASLATMA